MPAIAFDTHRYVKRLEEAGVSVKQAEAEADVLSEALRVNLETLATKADIAGLAGRIDGLAGQIRMMMWMMGVMAAGMFGILWRLFTIGGTLH